MLGIVRRTLHYAAYALAGVVIVLSSLALVLRLWILPDIDRYRPELARLIGEATGMPARIGTIAAGWRGLSPYLRLSHVQLLPDGELPALTLPRVEATVSWTSVLFADLRLASLEVDHPHLFIRRDRQGVIYVAGIPVNTDSSPSAFPDWLLRQRLTVVRKATLVWQDELLNAPPLTLSELDLLLLNRLGRHRLALTARPPDSVARWLDVRADFRGRTVKRLEDFAGKLYVYAMGATATALGTWAPWAQPSVRSGHGSLRFWLDFSQRRIDGVVGDVRLQRVGIGPTESLPEIRFERIDGRLGWRRTQTGHDYYVERLSFTAPSGRKAAPASVRVHVAHGDDGKLDALRVEVKALRLEALTALIGAVPIPRQAHDLIEAHEPHGQVDRLQLSWQAKGRYSLQARFQEVGLRAGHGVPSLAGLSGEVMASERGGEAHLDTQRLTWDDAQIFRHPLAFDRAKARLAWKVHATGGLALLIDDLRLTNADLAATGGGSILLKPGAAPQVNLTARLRRGMGNAVWRYLPRSVSDDAYHWIRRGIKAGLAEEASLILRGPLDRFPFHQGGGQFRVDVKLRDAEVEVAPEWPRFVGIQGHLVFRDTAMELILDTARIAGVPGIALSGIRGIVPDLHFSDDEILFIEGRAHGPTSAFLDYIRTSPIHDYIDRFTEPMRAQGEGGLSLRLNLPLRRIAASTVAGVYRLVDNRLDPGHGMPVLEHLSGEIGFTHRQVNAKGLSAQLLGQPATLDLHSGPAGRIILNIDGRLQAAALAPWIGEGLLRRVKGAMRYRAELAIHRQQTDLRVESELEGVAIDLPPPLGKPAERVAPLLVTLSHAVAQTNVLVKYDKILTARALLGESGDQPRISVRIGHGDAPPPRHPGLTLEAAQSSLNLDAWLALIEGVGGKGPDIHALTLTANELIVFDRRLTGTQLAAQKTAAGWLVQVAGRELEGEISWQPTGTPTTIEGRFRRLNIPPLAANGATVAQPPRSTNIEAVVRVDSLQIADRDLGVLELIVRPDVRGMRLQMLRLTNPDGHLEANGLLSDLPQGKSSLELKLESGNLSALLSRLGYPGNLRRGEGSVKGRLSWQGGLADLALDRLSGHLDIQFKKGQFTKLDPGAGRLLGVFSLQALPRRISLDFRDIFTEGFAFDELVAGVRLKGEVAHLDVFNMRGPAASISMQGEVDLIHETQSLRVAVQPRLEDTLAAGAMLINPAVGVGALVASKVLKDPISRAATFEYLVRGSWTEPEVKRLQRPRAAEDAAATDAP